MNNWLNRLERKYGRFGIPNLTNILVAGQILVFAIELFVNAAVTGYLGLNRYFLLSGEIWRIITFVFIPFSGGSLLSIVLGIYFTWFVGTALEREWGDFRYTVYFVIPIRVKYFGFFAAVLWVFSFLGASLPGKLNLLLSMLNVWLFFGPMAYRSVRAWIRREQWKRKNRR